MFKSVLIKSLLTIICLLMMHACAPSGIYHTVKPGQTLYTIARTYDIEEARLARINNIKDPTQLRANQKIYIPGVTQLRKVPVTAASANKPKSTTATRPTAQTVAPTSKKAPEKTVSVKKATPAKQPNATVVGKPVKGIFVWPAKGKVLNNFGKQGEKVYKGIEIDIPKGSAVVAAASGKVIYSGNAIPGYGNLVILEHSDSFFSVYGYNDKRLVKMDDHVGQGDKIALSGSPPDGRSARLHFEIRKGKSAVNPILFLP